MAEQATKQLVETQQSLAAALAHVEIQRLRLKKLELENVALRNILRRHGLNPGEEEQDEAAAADWQHEAQCDTADSMPALPTQTRSADASADPQSQDVILHTSNAKIPGKVIIKDQRIEFMAIAAEIQPAAFVGMKFLGTFFEGQASTGLARRSVGRSSWWESLFGPTYTGSSPEPMSAAATPPTPTAWTTKPKSRSKKTRESSPTVSPSASLDPPPLPQAAEAGDHTISDSIAAGIQEGLSSISQFTGYLRGDLSRRSATSSASPSREQSVQGRSVLRSCSTETLSAPARLPAPSGDLPGPWQIIWRDAGGQDMLQTLTFEASVATRTEVQETVDRWNDDQRRGDGRNAAMPQPERKVVRAEGSRVRDPEHLLLGQTFMPSAASQSTLLSPEEVACLASALPGRRKLSQWQLLYSSEADGFSLQTLYRAGGTSPRTLLIVEDFHGYVFGAYCTDSLRVNPRYQGNGECFVFQMRPHRLKYDWHQTSEGTGRNDFFMMVSQDSIGIGGAPHFALWLDSDLLYGNSGVCHTFSSPCLSGKEDFKVKAVELWQIGS
eukprot:jgi/Ulvmu1/9017/UM005_0108.1